MIRWSEHLYIDEDIEDEFKAVKRKIEKGKFQFNVYCIMISSNSSNMLDIVNSNELRFDFYKNRENVILGIAKGKSNAVLIVKNMIMDYFNAFGTYNIRSQYADV